MNIYCQPRSLFPREIFLPSFMVYEAGVDFCRKKLWDLQLPDLWKNDQQVKFPIADVFSFNLSKVKFQTPYPFGEDLFSGPGSWVKASNVARPFQPRQVDVSFKRYPPLGISPANLWETVMRRCSHVSFLFVGKLTVLLLMDKILHRWEWTNMSETMIRKGFRSFQVVQDFVHQQY